MSTLPLIRDDETVPLGIYLRLVIPSTPVGQPRAKATSFGGNTRMYTPTTITNKETGEKKPHPIVLFKAMIRHMASELYRDAPLAIPLRVDVTFVFPRDANKVWKSKPMPRYPHIKAPDRDNCDKAVLDGLKGIILADDKYVCAGEVQKWHAAGDEQPHVEIVVSEVRPQVVEIREI